MTNNAVPSPGVSSIAHSTGHGHSSEEELGQSIANMDHLKFLCHFCTETWKDFGAQPTTVVTSFEGHLYFYESSKLLSIILIRVTIDGRDEDRPSTDTPASVCRLFRLASHNPCLVNSEIGSKDQRQSWDKRTALGERRMHPGNVGSRARMERLIAQR